MHTVWIWSGVGGRGGVSGDGASNVCVWWRGGGKDGWVGKGEGLRRGGEREERTIWDVWGLREGMEVSVRRWTLKQTAFYGITSKKGCEKFYSKDFHRSIMDCRI